MLPRFITGAFPLAVRARGDQYFSSRRVRIARAGETNLTALVSGTMGYVVSLDAKPVLLSASCSCPYAADNGICKHIWATLRHADAESKLQPLIAFAGARARFSADVGGDDEVDDEGEGCDDATLALEEGWLVSREPIQPLGRPTPGKAPRRTDPAPRKATIPEWRTLLNNAGRRMDGPPPIDAPNPPSWPANRRLVYIVDLPSTWQSNGLVVELATERQQPDGSWDPPAQFHLSQEAWHAVPDPVDRQIAQMLVGATPTSPYESHARRTAFLLRGAALGTTLRLMCETGRCRVRAVAAESPVDSLRWDGGPPWLLRLRVARTAPGACAVTGVLVRPDDEMPLVEPLIVHSEGWLISGGAFAWFDHAGAFALGALFRERDQLPVGDEDLPSFLEALYSLPRIPTVDLPTGTRVSEVHEPPQPCLTVAPHPWQPSTRYLTLGFRYGSLRITGETFGATVFDAKTLEVRHRDAAAESEARNRLVTNGAKEEHDYVRHMKVLAVSVKKLGPMILDLVSAGWHVEANGGVYRTAGAMRAVVRSGIDWFELDAGVRFGDIEVSLPDLLAARRTGAATLVLSDGSHGVLPIDWLARLGPVAVGGESVGGVMRYRRSQVALLDALLASIPDANVDATFEKARAELRTFDRVAPVDPGRTFSGTLREYQREGLGWLHFLRRFQLGGCLADDMGLGKTVQVLALLDARRGTRAKPSRPSIIVVPRSLVFNWMREAERFAPHLRVLDFTGAGRRASEIDPAAVDVAITTYGTLRRDAAELAAIRFDYAILDEAQAIKNAASASAKAARLLNADHRLVMTGTPIENRLEELWSLFEFMNPGMLGSSSAFSALVRLAADSPSPTADGAAVGGRDLLAQAIRPVVLRRTKEQVADDLPERTEQTLTVELEPAQRHFYDGLLDSYRRSVLDRVDRVGVGRARMHILEALLRLRQAACHPALADPRLTDAPSAKLDALLPSLEEITAQGHKTLVFSQFTTFLALLRSRLDAKGVRYEYLDGRVRDRQSRVDRFQNDPECPVFLISLKAGGHGLNLTAADYVFLLDPWWNPAVEAQAIDRAHRIGQTRHVIATRLVARETIEEKILELQASKRALADAILGQDQGVLARIGREELEMLLR